MLTMLTLFIPGKPQAQGRARACTTRRGKIRMYDPEKSANWKQKAAGFMLAARQAMGGAWPKNGALALDICAVFPQAKRHRGGMFHTARPDADNLAKAVMDAGNGVLWTDDARIASLSIIKRVGPPETAGVTVQLSLFDS